MQNNNPGRPENQPIGSQNTEKFKSGIMTLVKANQGTDGHHPETGKAKFHPYKIPPDLEICNEYKVS